MPIGKGSVQFSVIVPAKDIGIAKEIEKRIGLLGDRWTMGGYVMDVLRWWKAQGYPPVTPQDHAMLIAAGASPPKKK